MCIRDRRDTVDEAGHLVRAVSVASVHQHSRAAPGERDRRGPADPGRRPGDQGDSARHLHPSSFPRELNPYHSPPDARSNVSAMERRHARSGSPYEDTIGFSRAVRVGSMVAVSGTAPIWADGHVDPDPTAQARRCWEIVVSALEELGASVSDVCLLYTSPSPRDS